jgi:hypothetical protein
VDPNVDRIIAEFDEEEARWEREQPL